MKHVMIATVLALSSMNAFAAGTSPKAAAPAKVAVTKASKNAAKKECKEEGKTGKDLKSCVKSKLEAKS